MRPVLLCAALMLPHSAQSQSLSQTLTCAPREQVLRLLIDQRSERRQASGHLPQGAQMELFSADSGAWTIIVHLPDGRSCLLAHGDGFVPTGGLQPARGRPA